MIERMLQKDLIVKILAVALALAIWADVSSRENPTETLAIEAALNLETPEGKILVSQSVDRVKITFSGRSRALNDLLKPEEIAISVDLSEVPVGTTTLPITYTSPYAALDVTSILPPTVTVEITTRESKEVGIAVTVRGTPNKEYTADRPAYVEETVTVTGPKSNVERVQTVTGEIDVTGAVSTTTSMVTLVPRDSFGNEIAQLEVDPPKIEVSVFLSQRPPAKRVPVKVDTIGTPKAGYKLVSATAAPEYVEIRGETSVTSNISEIRTRPIDVSGRDAGSKSTVLLVVPSGALLEGSNSVSVTVDIQPDVVRKTFSNVAVQPENLPIGYGFDVLPPFVDVELSGRSDILETVKASDVQAFINAGDIDPSQIGAIGEFPRPVYLIDLPEGIRIEKISYQHVTLKLIKR